MQLLNPLIEVLRRAVEGGAIPMRHEVVDIAGPRDAVLVIDASPSMEDTDWPPSRLAAAQEAARSYVERLVSEEPDASVGIVAYDGGARKVCKLIPVRELRKLFRAIGMISADDGSGTNITAGLRVALKMLDGRGKAAQTIILTDGEHNTGVGPTAVAARLRKIATLECVGIGGHPTDVNEALLKELASAYPDGSKRYRWIGDKERLVQHFRKLAGRITRK